MDLDPAALPDPVQILTPTSPEAPKEVVIEIEEDASLTDIKTQLQELTGIAIRYQKVMLAGVGQMVMADKR